MSIYNILDLKKELINSPIRERLGESISLPYKELIYENLSEVLESIEDIENNRTLALKVVVVGEVKSGKSSLVNELLSRHVSEVDVLEATSSIIEITYGEEDDKIVKNDLIQIKLNVDYLKKINIVDTPGLRSITIDNENKTLKYIKNADVILFVIDATHLGQEDIVDSLELISSLNKKVVGVVNKSDLLKDDKESIYDYVKEEYGMYIDEFYMVSSQLEYQDRMSKRAKAGKRDLIVANDKELRENFVKLNECIKEMYNNNEELKKQSIAASTRKVVHREILYHSDYLKTLDNLIEDITKQEKTLEEKYNYINSKMEFEIDHFLDQYFLVDEINRIKSSINNTHLYINEHYINELVNKKKVELDRLFFSEWDECLREISKDLSKRDGKNYSKRIDYKNDILETPNFKLDNNDKNLNNVLATIGTGAILGITSGGVVSVYAASLGASASTVTIGSALMTYCPPLLIAGTITGAIGKVIYDKVITDKKQNDVLRDIEIFKERIKADIKDNFIEAYKITSKEIIMVTLDIIKQSKSIYMSKYEVEEYSKEIKDYITKLSKTINE